MTSVCRENKIQGGFSPSSRSGWSHRMEMEKMQVLCRPPRRCAWRATEGLHASNGPCTNGGRAWTLAGMCQALIPVPIGQVGD